MKPWQKSLLGLAAPFLLYGAGVVVIAVLGWLLAQCAGY